MTNGATRLRWWRALSYEPVQEDLVDGKRFELDSRLHSSDARHSGVNPYWLVGNDTMRVFFAIEWCGGWRAALECNRDALTFDVRLPPDQTQLVLRPGETIDGPALDVTFVRSGDDARAHAEWMRTRRLYARKRFAGPEPSFPLCYNHWYTTRFDLDGRFLRRQAGLITEYGFDAFIVDAGWYEHVGAWRPDLDKFAEGEFEEILRSVKQQGVKPGIWTCPQFVGKSANEGGLRIDKPGFYEDFIAGRLVQLADPAFQKWLPDHVTELRERYSAL